MTALEHCGYRGEDEEDSGFSMTLETPYEGAEIRAEMRPSDGSGREWRFGVAVYNSRGVGWDMGGIFLDTGRYVAKTILRSLALEMRRVYCHRGQKVRRRAIARAKARALEEGGAR